MRNAKEGILWYGDPAARRHDCVLRRLNVLQKSLEAWESRVHATYANEALHDRLEELETLVRNLADMGAYRDFGWALEQISALIDRARELRP